jgi:GR25 family glycosyltransferase involved in LPS biosynthesis
MRPVYMYIYIAIIIIILIILLWNKKEGMTQGYLNGIDAIYWINLDRSPERRDNMMQMFKDEAFQGIPNHRISAIDGANPENVDNKMNTEKKTVSDKEYACLLSHLEAIRAFQESDSKIALIMEDDATLEFKKYWKKTVNEIMNEAPSDWEIIMLNYILTYDSHPFWNWKLDKTEYSNQLPAGAMSYIINKQGANKLTQDYVNSKYQIHQNTIPVADMYIFYNVKTYCYKYPMFVYKTDNDSTLHESHLSMHVNAKELIIKNYEDNI